MCSLNHAIKLYQKDKKFVIIKTNDNCQLPIKNKLYNSFEEADIDRIYYQASMEEKLRVISI